MTYLCILNLNKYLGNLMNILRKKEIDVKICTSQAPFFKTYVLLPSDNAFKVQSQPQSCVLQIRQLFLPLHFQTHNKTAQMCAHK